MDILFIDNFIVSGVHGFTAKEKCMPQRFRVDMKIKINSGAHVTDKIENTFDYRVARKIIIDIFENESFDLLETLAERVVQRVIINPKTEIVTLSIKKLDIWNSGMPGITITRHKIPNYINLLDFDIEKIIEELCKNGGSSFSILNEERRLKLLEEAKRLAYIKQPEIVGRGRVREELSSVIEFPDNSLFWQLRDNFTELLIRKLKISQMMDIFEIPLIFNDMSLQKYEKQSIGITPHIDGKSRINLIFVFVLCGKADFAICRDRNGSSPKFLDTTPGNVIVLRGPGFFKSSFQPFHFVGNITEERIVFGLRQRMFFKRREK